MGRNYTNTLLRQALWHLKEHDRKYQHVTPEPLKENIIDYLVDEWHAHNSSMELHEYLGMTWEEYEIWIKGK